MDNLVKKHQKALLLGSFSILMMLTGFAIIQFTSCVTVQAQSCPQHQEATAFVERQAVQLAPNYYQYNEETYAEAQKSGKKVVLYFWAPWCTTCASVDLDLVNGVVQVPDDIILLRIDYDAESELRKQYGVVTQHTFVQVDQDGKTLAFWIGGDIDNFAKFIR